MAISARITPTDLGPRLPQHDVTLLDVRTPAEFKTSHIAGSVNVPVDFLEDHAAQIGQQLDGDVVLICRSGARAERAEAALAKVGVSNLSVLDGGMEAWRSAGQPEEYGEPHWDLERQVRLVAGSLVATSVAASTVLPKAKWPAGAIGGGLVFAAATNTCAMGNLLSKLPYNRTNEAPTLSQVTARLQPVR